MPRPATFSEALRLWLQAALNGHSIDIKAETLNWPCDVCEERQGRYWQGHGTRYRCLCPLSESVLRDMIGHGNQPPSRLCRIARNAIRHRLDEDGFIEARIQELILCLRAQGD